MSITPKMFIGSSTEQLKTAEHLQVNLGDRIVMSVNWTQSGIFEYNDAPLDSLIDAVNNSDFACFFIEPDDIIITRGEEKTSLRDNVIFELGLFLGRLGKKRVFIIKNRDIKDLNLPSDFAGIHFLNYSPNNANGDIRASLNKVSIEIKHYIEDLGIYGNNLNADTDTDTDTDTDSPARRIDEVMERGSAKFIDNIADAAIFIAEEKYKYKSTIKANILANITLAPKFLYYTEESCRHWLELCTNPMYKFYGNSISFLTASIEELTNIITKESQHTAFDFISLGVGNGKKDNIILKALEKNLNPNDKNDITYYYPIDISDPMIVEAIRGSLSELNRDKIKVKAIIADFLKLPTLNKIYEERPSRNIFSLLGNTLGNSNETDIFKALRDSMLEGDFLLIEVNVDQEGIKDEKFLYDDLNIFHDFSPLSSLGVTLQKKNMKYDIKSNDRLLSVVDNTQTVVATYKSAKIDSSNVKNIKLSMINHYHLGSLSKTLKETLNLEILFEKEKNGVGLILGYLANKK